MAGMSSGDITRTGCAMLESTAGFRALPVDPETKQPFPWLTSRGVRDATADATTLAQMLAVAGGHDGGCSLAIVPGDRFVVVDDDTGEFDMSHYGLRGTFSESTRRGIHAWAHVPDGQRLRKSRLPNGAGDIITGDSAYVVISPSAGYKPTDIAAPVHDLPDDSPLREIAALRQTTPAPRVVCTEADRLEAVRLAERMRESSDYGPGIAAILEGASDWHRHFPQAEDTSDSGRDSQLALAATHFLRDNDRAAEIIAALLEIYSWKAQKTHNPHGYITRTASRRLPFGSAAMLIGGRA